MSAIPPPETFKVKNLRSRLRRLRRRLAGAGTPARLSPYRPAVGCVECGYCDRRFVLEGGLADPDK